MNKLQYQYLHLLNWGLLGVLLIAILMVSVFMIGIWTMLYDGNSVFRSLR